MKYRQSYTVYRTETGSSCSVGSMPTENTYQNFVQPFAEVEQPWKSWYFADPRNTYKAKGLREISLIKLADLVWLLQYKLRNQ